MNYEEGYDAALGKVIESEIYYIKSLNGGVIPFGIETALRSAFLEGVKFRLAWMSTSEEIVP
jgi:hypothetical protein